MSKYILILFFVTMSGIATSKPPMRLELRDAKNALIGVIEESGNRRVLRDAKNRYAGVYDRASNETRDANNRFVGKGDLLSSLVR
jgi:hypothetical protein